MVTVHPGTSIGVTLADPDLEPTILAVLADVEDRLFAAITSDDPLVAEAASHLATAGGKRLRPLLVALTAHLGDPKRPEVAASATVVELTHLATLYHDDVMDEATLRRGTPSANARWGNSVAILVGDFLFARAADVAADLGAEAVRIQSRTFSRLVHGQIAETIGPRDGDPVAHHLHVVSEKTGSLMATSARFGAMFSGAPADQVEAMARYGEIVGMAFQLSDDLLDIGSESVQSGKTPGTDLREGVHTLPVLYALRSDEPGRDAVRLRELLSDGPVQDAHRHAEALALLRGSTAMRQARSTVHRYTAEALGYLDAVPDGPARRALAELCTAIADRTG